MPSTAANLSQKGSQNQAKKNINAPQAKKPGSVAPRTITSVRDEDQEDDEFAQWETKALLKPDDQLNLTETELKEEMTRILKANNPNAPQNIVRFSHKEKAYKLAPHVEQLAIHFQLDGNLIHKESEEAKRQLTTKTKDVSDASSDVKVETEAVKEDEDDEEKKAGGKEKQLKNQFNYSDRASQTYNNPMRDRTTMTEPPPRINFASNATQWEIFDAYQDDFEAQQKNKETKKTLKAAEGKKSEKIQPS